MWELHKTNEARQWELADRFETVTAAVRHLLDIEGLTDRTGIHLEMYVDTNGTDDEAFGHFEYTGRKALYVIKRKRLAH